MNLSKIIMENIMNRNKMVLQLTVIGAVLIIALPTLIKIYEGHQNRLYEVATKQIKESALACFQNFDCENSITLGDLKEKGYLGMDVVNPKTKTYFPDDLIIVNNHYTVSFQNE